MCGQPVWLSWRIVPSSIDDLLVSHLPTSAKFRRTKDVKVSLLAVVFVFPGLLFVFLSVLLSVSYHRPSHCFAVNTVICQNGWRRPFLTVRLAVSCCSQSYATTWISIFSSHFWKESEAAYFWILSGSGHLQTGKVNASLFSKDTYLFVPCCFSLASSLSPLMLQRHHFHFLLC